MKQSNKQEFQNLPLTRKVLADGVAYFNINGLYEICKYKKDAEFIYKLILKNCYKQGAPKAYILLDGHELTLKRRQVFKLGVSINDNYNPLANIASKLFKDFKEPETSLKLSGMFLYRFYQNAPPIVIPCQESNINNESVPYYSQYHNELCLPCDYLMESSFDGSLLPQSTQLFGLVSLQHGEQENYLYFYTGDIKAIIAKHLSFRDPDDFLNFNAEREFRNGKEVIDELNSSLIIKKPSQLTILVLSEASNDSKYETEERSITFTDQTLLNLIYALQDTILDDLLKSFQENKEIHEDLFKLKNKTMLGKYISEVAYENTEGLKERTLKNMFRDIDDLKSQDTNSSKYFSLLLIRAMKDIAIKIAKLNQEKPSSSVEDIKMSSVTTVDDLSRLIYNHLQNLDIIYPSYFSTSKIKQKIEESIDSSNK